jgi:Zn-dependent protease
MTDDARTRRPRWSFPLVRVAGIEIRVHVTFFLLVPLFAWAGTQAGGPGVVGALVWLVVIFGCVVLHEFGHCFVARRRGVNVHEIDLLPIGGVSKLERLPERGRDEFAIAIAGPAVSGAIAAACALVAIAAAIPMTPIDWFGGPIVPRLMWFNLVIGAFNLLPAFPLDGGRVFRSLLERTHTLEEATRIATRLGRRLAVAMGVVGLLVSPLLVFVAVFIYFGAAAEEAATIIHLRLERRTVGDVMARDLRAVEVAVDVQRGGCVEQGRREGHEIGDDCCERESRAGAQPLRAPAPEDREAQRRGEGQRAPLASHREAQADAGADQPAAGAAMAPGERRDRGEQEGAGEHVQRRDPRLDEQHLVQHREQRGGRGGADLARQLQRDRID